jgi:hypothetical protein
MPPEPRYWFPAKRYGWGWGPPITWEGWLVMLVFFCFVIAGVVLVPPQRSLPGFIGYFVLLIVLLAATCYWKGEPPRWRWGDD